MRSSAGGRPQRPPDVVAQGAAPPPDEGREAPPSAPRAAVPVTSATRALEVVGLDKSYGGRPALRGLDLHVDPGEVVGLLGPNGAGKSTTMKVLVGLVRPDAGTARILGSEATDPAARRSVGYLPELFRFPDWMTGLDVLRFHGQLLDLRDVEAAGRDALGRVGLAGRGDERVGGYSKGMAQRLGLAQALLGEPALVLLDEPTSALDPLGRREVRALVRELRARGAAVLVNSHLLGEVEQVCDRVVIVDRGRVVHEGRLDDLAVGAVEVRVRLDRVDARATELAEGFGAVVAVEGATIALVADDARDVPALAEALVRAGYGLAALVPTQPSLEDLFARLVRETSG